MAGVVGAGAAGAGEVGAAAAADEDTGAGAGFEATGAGAGCPFLIALDCAVQVVDTIGHPLPGPFKFCRVIDAAVNLAN